MEQHNRTVQRRKSVANFSLDWEMKRWDYKSIEEIRSKISCMHFVVKTASPAMIRGKDINNFIFGFVFCSCFALSVSILFSAFFVKRIHIRTKGSFIRCRCRYILFFLLRHLAWTRAI